MGPQSVEAIGINDNFGVGKKKEITNKSRPVLVKLGSPVKARIFEKKKWKNNEEVKQDMRFDEKVIILYIEDITLPQQKLPHRVMGLHCVEYTFVRDGAIFAKRRGPAVSNFCSVVNTDDLCSLGESVFSMWTFMIWPRTGCEYKY